MDKREALKSLFRRLHEGESPERVKSEFAGLIKHVTPTEISLVEQELIQEGIPSEEIQKLCDVHLRVLKESLDKERPLAPPGHPINILMEEHKMLLEFAEELRKTVDRIEAAGKAGEADTKQLTHLVEHFQASESHYLREENVLFPSLEKHGITEPPKIMWTEHDKIREIERKLYSVVDTMPKTDFSGFAKSLKETAMSLSDMLSNHFYKENNILFTAAMDVVSGDEWRQIRSEFDDIGYCCFTPESATVSTGGTEGSSEVQMAGGTVQFDTGTLSVEELDAIFGTLPVDITFVDKDDKVGFFSESGGRIFVRTKAVLGRSVQNCHPQKSLHAVNKILDELRSGKKDSAEFWLTIEGKFVYIRYFPVRNRQGEYLGCLEVTQDITEIRQLKGEKRLP
jgi:hypothetical protein